MTDAGLLAKAVSSERAVSGMPNATTSGTHWVNPNPNTVQQGAGGGAERACRGVLLFRSNRVLTWGGDLEEGRAPTCCCDRLRSLRLLSTT